MARPSRGEKGACTVTILLHDGTTAVPGLKVRRINHGRERGEIVALVPNPYDVDYHMIRVRFADATMYYQYAGQYDADVCRPDRQQGGNS